MRPGHGARPRRHVLSDLSPAGHPDRARLSARRHDEPDLFERARSAEGPPAADHVFEQGASASSRSPAISAPSFRRPSAGRWRRAYKGDDRIAASWIGDGTTAEGDFHYALHLRLGLSRAGDPQHRQQSMGDFELLGHRRRRRNDLRVARPSATACRRCGSTATISSRSMPRRNGRRSARAPISAPR